MWERSRLRNLLFVASSANEGESERANGRWNACGNIEDVKVRSSAAFEPACRSISDKRRGRVDMNVTISAKCGTEALLFVWNADNKSAVAPDNVGAAALLPEVVCAAARCTTPGIPDPPPAFFRLNTATLEYVPPLFYRATISGSAAESRRRLFPSPIMSRPVVALDYSYQAPRSFERISASRRVVLSREIALAEPDCECFVEPHPGEYRRANVGGTRRFSRDFRRARE